jgi:hypothetical protein
MIELLWIHFFVFKNKQVKILINKKVLQNFIKNKTLNIIYLQKTYKKIFNQIIQIIKFSNNNNNNNNNLI